MKKQTKSKVKSKSKTKPAARPAKQQTPDLATTMIQIADRLESLERKMDLLMEQLPSQQRSESKQIEPAIERHEIQPAYVRHDGPKPNQGPARHQNHRQQNGQQKARPLHQAVCAECSKSCEVPFKPVAERPVYCKECYAKRKSGKQSSKKNNHSRPHPLNSSSPAHSQPTQFEKRVLRVVPHGVGKVTISEMVKPKSPKFAKVR